MVLEGRFGEPAACATLILRVLSERTVSAAGDPGRAPPAAAHAVSGQGESSVCGERCGEVTRKEGEGFCAVLVVFPGRTRSAAGYPQPTSGAARLSHAGPGRTRLCSHGAGRTLWRASSLRRSDFEGAL